MSATAMDTATHTRPHRSRRRWRTARAAILAAFMMAVTAACGSPPPAGPTRQAALKVAGFASGANNEVQYAAIWETPPSQSQLNDAQQFLRELDDDVIRVAPQANRSAAQTFLDSYAASTEAVVTLIGHNDGTAFRFADESYVELNVLEQVNGPPLAFISCDSATVGGQVVGVPGAITPAFAALLEQRVVAAVAELDSAPTRDQLAESHRSTLRLSGRSGSNAV